MNEAYSTTHSALILVDVLNEFLAEDGMLAPTIGPMVKKLHLKANLQRLVEGTGRHALEARFHVTFLTDAVADFTDTAHQAALEVSYPSFGHQVTTVDALLAAIERAPA